jgi:hypothetical protein
MRTPPSPRLIQASLRVVSGRVSTRLLLGLVACLALGWTVAESSFPTDFFFTYPTSQSDDHVVGGTGQACQLCHRDPDGDEPWNGYGWDIKQMMDGGLTVQAAIPAVESMDSDGDPGGTSNLDEINAGHQPGWTNGPNNTVFFKNGSSQTGQLPPAGILGDLDPVDPWVDLGQALAGAGGLATLTGSGDLVVGNPVTLTLSNAAPSTLAVLFIGVFQLNAPFKGGVLVPSNTFNFGLFTDGSGGIGLTAPFPPGAPPNFTFYFQYWWVDAGGPVGFASSNAISGTTP